MYKEIGIKNKLIELAEKAENDLEEIFKNIKRIEEFNSIKVLKAMQKYRLSEMHFGQTTGYGYNDIGRDIIEKIYADIFKAEDSLVRTQFISGTHALSVALFSILRPNDTMLSINGKPYDTLDEVIGIKENGSSLKSYGVNYEEIELKEGKFDKDKIMERVKKGNIKLICIQRSSGYANRKSFLIEEIAEIIKLIKDIDKNIIVMVDNCYGEFVQEKEPIEVGADIAVRFFN